MKGKRGRPRLIKPEVDQTGSGSDSRNGKPEAFSCLKDFASGPKSVSRNRRGSKKFVSLDNLDIDPETRSEILSREIVIRLECCDGLVEKLKKKSSFGGVWRPTDAAVANGFRSGRKRKSFDDGFSEDSGESAPLLSKRVKRRQPAKEISKR